MLLPVEGIVTTSREPLLENWSICCATPGEPVGVVPEVGWLSIRRLMPVAAALRELKQWSIDGPTRRFDAQEWWYRLKFDAPKKNIRERFVLGFDGLATVAEVWLNGNALISSSNMFVAHECEVSFALKERDNEILIRFSALDAELKEKRKRPRWRTPMVENQQLRWFRTTLLGRTPGWSPPAAIVGPWKDIWLERRDHNLEFNSPTLDVGVQDGAGFVGCNFKIETNDIQSIDSVYLQIERGTQVHTHRLIYSAATESFEGELAIDNVELWWPHTHGSPVLYAAKMLVTVRGQTDRIVMELGRIGFRTIQLDTKDGEFRLSVNGIPVFCRGACWTPLDPVTLRASASEYHVAIEQACNAGMNMVRVSGTMVYEDDEFFNTCDELGMLVWQDFMFANMDYPVDDAEFLASATLEICQQIRRRQATASLAILCGNSEVSQQAAMWGAPRELWQSAFFDDTLSQICAQYAPRIPYWPSSAYLGSFPFQANQGTTSYYGVGAYLRETSDARHSDLRFASECLAFANVPSSTSISRLPGGLATKVHHPGWKARSPRDLGAGWDFDDVRDHYLASLFKVDPQKLRYSDHDRYLTLSRVVTGELMSASFTEWRRPASTCRGALVLFLRDLWAGAGWGLIDEAGAPKACYHYLKRALQPNTVLLSDEGGNGLTLHVINEGGREANVELEVTAWARGSVQVASGRQTLVLAAHSATSRACQDLFEHFIDMTDAYRFGPKVCDVVVATLRKEDGEQLAQSFYFPGGMDVRQELDIGLNACARKVDSNTYELTIGTKGLAVGVHFDIDDYVADAEYFHMAPNSTVKVMIRSRTDRPPRGSTNAINLVSQARLSISA